MGPLSSKAKVQEQAGMVKNQMVVIKTLSDEARKKDLHKLKMAKEIAKAKAEGIPIDEASLGAADGVLSVPKPGTAQPATTLKESSNKGKQQPSHGVTIPPIGNSGPSVTLKNPEAGPSDTVPAMLTPGEAVIPASVAQDSAYKPVIEALVEEGRMRNRQPGGVKGFADGGVVPVPVPAGFGQKGVQMNIAADLQNVQENPLDNMKAIQDELKRAKEPAIVAELQGLLAKEQARLSEFQRTGKLVSNPVVVPATPIVPEIQATRSFVTPASASGPSSQ